MERGKTGKARLMITAWYHGIQIKQCFKMLILWFSFTQIPAYFVKTSVRKEHLLPVTKSSFNKFTPSHFHDFPKSLRLSSVWWIRVVASARLAWAHFFSRTWLPTLRWSTFLVSFPPSILVCQIRVVTSLSLVYLSSLNMWPLTSFEFLPFHSKPTYFPHQVRSDDSRTLFLLARQCAPACIAVVVV